VRLSVVFVHYRTPELARRAVESVVADAARSALDVEILLVDNGSDAAGRELLAALPVTLLEPGANLGFAGGVNLGARQAAGEALLLANPDLELLPGALSALAGALAAGAAAAGPRFFWDRERRYLLPPAERRDRASVLAAALARRGGGLAHRARARWRRHARRHWQAVEAVASHHLSGALVAVSRDAWDRVGPFDPGYPLYFEETDWLRRLHRLGLVAVHQPRAEVVHHYNRSAGGEPRAPDWYAESARRFAERWYGPLFRRLAAAAGGSAPAPPWPPSVDGPPALDLPPTRRPLWVELSPSPLGFPAVAERLPAGIGRWVLPDNIWRRLDAGRWRATVCDEAGRELAAVSFERPPQLDGPPAAEEG
jgi:hypothetical protein